MNGVVRIYFQMNRGNAHPSDEEQICGDLMGMRTPTGVLGRRGKNG